MIERLARFFGGASFHRGLALGALVGAAIAGSTLWNRLRAAGQVPEASSPEHPPRPGDRAIDPEAR